jgi:hypothetical protein
MKDEKNAPERKANMHNEAPYCGVREATQCYLSAAQSQQTIYFVCFDSHSLVCATNKKRDDLREPNFKTEG